tara:strand:+ start:2028 stop:2708 length:681 start_codon:yes stop_codon:yes gene_type:complete
MKKLIPVLLVLLSFQIMAQEKLQSIVNVTGEGIVTVVPDQVTISMSVENTGDDVIALKSLNDKTVDAVLNHIKQSGVEAKDIQTQYVSLNKRYDYNTKTYSFHAKQTITVLLRDLKKYDPLVSGLVQRGINSIDGITFGSSKAEELKSQARKNAIANAKMKAQEYAGVLNQKIGKAIQISEQGNYNPPMPLYRSEAVMMSDSGGGETLAVGEMEMKVKIQVVFELQ